MVIEIIHVARSQLFHVHIEYERRNRPKRSRFTRLERVGFVEGAGRKFSRRRRRSLNARSATWGVPNGGTRMVHSFYVGLVERIPRAQHNYSSWHSRELSGTARRSLGGDLCTKRDETRRNHNTVSYTHLTLPTILLV